MVRSWMFYIPGVRHLAVAGEGDRDETQQAFDRYLQLWADNEHRGCDGVFLSEHHFIGVSLSPSPHLLIAALSQRTSRLRLGVMSSALPLHDVRRLVEECGMLDYLSHGRLEIGIGPGAGTIEAGFAGVDPQEVRPRYTSGADLLDKYLSGSRVTHQDVFYNLVDVPIVPQMRQTHPPVWVTATSEGSYRWAAARGYKVCTAWLPTADVAELSVVYHSAATDAGLRSGPDKLGVRRRVFVAPTDTEAHDIAKRCADQMLRALDKMLQNSENAGRALGSVPSAGAVLANPRFNQPDDIIVGSPQTVTEQLAEQVKTTGIGNLLFFTDFKLFDHQDLVRSHDLIGTQVIPALRSLTPPTSTPATI
jgi:alkanesulfonate monooxygenase SsuD/methylene tetrahydromethanopterin reductase-like flavin-dependent oxidoreductase (luciferase family)